MRAFSYSLVAALVLPAALLAQAAEKPEKPDTATPKPARLFRDNTPVTMWLVADFKTVFKDRDTSATNARRYPAKMGFLGENGDSIVYDVQLATRGHFRLQANRGGCAFVPLKVYFDKEKTKGGLFGGEGSLKLTTHCNNGERFAQNVFIEYAANAMYNILTPVSLLVRLAEITYIDPANPKFTVTRPGFWSEDDEGMAKRNRGKILMTTGAGSGDMDPWQATLTDIFQYMIGNTDFSLYALHNMRIVQSDTGLRYFPMAYDFDWSGLVDAPYARPDYRLPIRRVTDRLYRGCDHEPELFARAADHFKAKKTEIYGTLSGIKGLTPNRLKEATSFLDEFYRVIGDPGSMKREFVSACRSSG